MLHLRSEMRAPAVAFFVLALLPGCYCGPLFSGGGGGGPTAHAATQVAPSMPGDAEPASPPSPLPTIALELGIDAATETTFRECTDPEGGHLAAFTGFGIRPWGTWAAMVRGGASA